MTVLTLAALTPDHSPVTTVHVTAIIAAAGAGRRLGAGVPKQLLEVDGRSLLEHSVAAFDAHPGVRDLVVVLPRELAAEPPAHLRATRKPLAIVAGGERRQDSVANAFDARARRQPTSCSCTTPPGRSSPRTMIARAIAAAAEHGAAIVAAPATDTIKRVDGRGRRRRDRRDDRARDDLPGPDAAGVSPRRPWRGRGARTFRASMRPMKRCLPSAPAIPSASSRAMPTNVKITTAGDLEAARAPRRAAAVDARRHGLRPASARRGTPLILGGVDVPCERGALGHSDADVVCHAATDAILGAAALGDIGRHFPDTDPAWKGASSIDLLRRAAAMVREAGFDIGNVDVVIILERPKIAPFVARIRDGRRRRARHRRRRGEREGQDERGGRRRRPRRGHRGARGRARETTVGAARDTGRTTEPGHCPMRVRFAPISHRSTARRQRAHGAVQLAAGPRQGRHLHPAHRGHRRRALDARVGDEHPRGPALARPRLGRGAGRRRAARPVPPERAAAPVRVVRERAGRRRPCLLLLLFAGEARGGPRSRRRRPSRPPKYHGTCRALTRDEARARIEAGERPVVRFKVPENVEVTFHDLVRGDVTLQHRGDRRSGDRALGRPARVQLRRRGRRCADGDHARDPRRGSHLEHAAAGADLPGARLHAAGVRAPLARDGAGPHAALEAARRDLGGRVPRSADTCRRRSSTTWR